MHTARPIDFRHHCSPCANEYKITCSCSLITHFFFSWTKEYQTCLHSIMWLVFQANWTKCVHHITDRHTWVDYSGQTTGQCDHPIPVLDQQKSYLRTGSLPHKTLVALVWDKRFMGNLPYIRNFRYDVKHNASYTMYLTCAPCTMCGVVT